MTTITDCPTCRHADATGSWADAPGMDGMTHCRRCHGTWARATEIQHCTACCRTFTNPGAADLHRGPNTCLDPAIAVDKQGRLRLTLSRRHFRPGTTVEIWSRPGPTESLENLRGEAQADS